MANTTTIGQRLRQARLDRNISLDELQQITKIQRRYLEAIEQDQYDELPGTFYIRAFVRQYAQAVGEDGDKLVAVLDGKETLDGSSVNEAPKRKAPESVQGSRKQLHGDPRPENKFVSLLPVILFGLLAVTIVGFVIFVTLEERKQAPMIAQSTSFTVEKTSESTSSTEVAKESSTKESSSSSQPTKESTTESSKPEEKKMAISMDDNSTEADTYMTIKDAKSPITLDFEGKTSGPCWIGVLANQQWVYQYTLAAGEKQSTSLPANVDNAQIILGAAGNVDIKVNKENLDFHQNNYTAIRKNINLSISYQK